MSTEVWDSVAAGLGAGAAGATVLSAVWGMGQLTRKQWDRTIGRRRAQSRILDQLACGSSLEFVESLLGLPQFLEKIDGREQRIYRLAGSWVVVELYERAMLSFSITITDPRMYHSTERLSFGQLHVRLGRSDFADVSHHPSGERMWVGARRHGYLQHHYFGNPGGYQDYWLSHNMCGATTGPLGNFWRNAYTGTYATHRSPSPQVRFQDNMPTEARSIVINDEARGKSPAVLDESPHL
ncbi:hypothetical protein QM787_25525 [Rhodococcus ruber]|uniref:Uncharacterized protein n=2 Tax=Rhodococcus ruber TaxID=1830 RepID=A0A098BN30_9NOCA|nr:MULTISPECIES: ETEC_3214 domain-containing protein [Rhodococcus]MBD8057304.1 hypothetical protein [Rhodococcus ruber]MCD2129916.1 hypothetical protein [Rhodococcus ruber]MCF8784620.1 hypothetical protein [Rhodococcus ruber]MCZ1075531.1 hypothetical protein [Rhodococcus sp. A5(2022)]MCZ4506322.1 hypothetical protein [Rhodococcus ruber]